MNDIRSEDLGSMGESFFNTLCKNIGFVANSSKADDKGGWDFEVEHRKTKQINYSNQSYPVYRVQVKSTAVKNEAKLTYSNLLKLIQYNGAAFIVLLKYSKNIIPDAVFILHIDEKFSEKIWKEIRKKQIQLKKFILNKNEKIIKFIQKNEIKPLDGANLKKSFDDHIGPNYLKYVEKKLRYLSKFEKQGQIKQFTWSFKSKEDINSMAKCFLGYKEEFNIDIAEFDAPFGIQDKIPRSTFDNHKTTITPNLDGLQQTTIFLKTSEFGKQYEFVGTTYTVPEQLREFSSKVRTKCNLFDFIFDHKTRAINLETRNIFAEDIHVEFKELYNFFSFLNDSKDGKKTYIKLVDLASNKSVEICLGVAQFNLPDDFKILFESINSTYKKLCELNMERGVISTKYLWDHIGRFNLFNTMDKEYIPEFVMEFESKGKNTPKVDVVIFNSVIEFANNVLVIFVAFYGAVQRLRDNVLLGKFSKSEFLGEFLLKHEENIDELIEMKSKYFEKSMESKGLTVLN